MVVCGGGYWCGNDNTSGVNSLPSVTSIDSSGNFLDENWGKLLGSQGLVNTEEVDLSHELLLTIHIDMNWNT